MAKRRRKHGKPISPPAALDMAAISRQMAEAQALHRNGQPKMAAERLTTVLEQVTAIDGLNIPNLHYLLAQAYFDLGLWSRANEAARQEVARNPRHPQALALLKTMQARNFEGGKLDLNVDHLPAPENYPPVSLCMIVKNEEQYLAGCLESVRDFVSEMIIVDTGSTDRTVEIARSFGARVEHFTWINDFAAARNESIKYASGDWIFWMDADDRLSPENAHRLKHIVAADAADAYLCQVVSPLSNAKAGAMQSSTLHLRLFRNHIGLKFDGAVHEGLTEAIRAAGSIIARTNIQIQHIGYDVSPAALQGKSERNYQILKTALAADPNNLKLRYYLGDALLQKKEFDTALEHFTAVITEPFDIPGGKFNIYLAHIGRVSAYHRMDQLAKAQQAAQQALAEFPDKRYLLGIIGMLHLQVDEPQPAVVALEQALAAPLENGVGPDWSDAILFEHLSRAHLLLGQRAAGRAAFLAFAAAEEAALAQVSAETLARARNLLHRGQPAALLDLLPAAPQNAEAQHLLAQAHATLGDWPAAAQSFGRYLLLTEPGAQPGQWTTLAGFSWQSGQFAAARRYAGHALAQNPADAAALNLLAMLALENGDAEEGAEYLLQAIAADPGHAPALDNLRTFCGQHGIMPLALIRRYSQRLLNAGNFKGAANLLSLATEHLPDDATADDYKLLALALQRTGQDDEAILAWQSAEKISTAYLA